MGLAGVFLSSAVGRWFDGGGNGKIYGKGMNVVRQGCERLPWVDSLKGVGIILVILGHSAIPDSVYQMIYRFHMPLFFFLSGFLFRGEFSGQWAWRKVNRLLVPYFLYGLLYIIVIRAVKGFSLTEMTYDLLSLSGISVLWFLPCLFLAEILGAYVITKCPGGRIRILIALIIAVAGYVLPHVWTGRLLVATAFYLAGNWWRFVRHQFRMNAAKYGLCILLMIGLIWDQKVDMANAIFGNFFLFYGPALGVPVFLISVFEDFSISVPAFDFIGVRSLEFMALHQLVPVLVRWLVALLGIEPHWILLKALIFALLAVACWGVHRYIPVLSGKGLHLFVRK